LVFKKNANFFDENCRKSQKFVIITSTPGHPGGGRLRKLKSVASLQYEHVCVPLPFVMETLLSVARTVHGEQHYHAYVGSTYTEVIGHILDLMLLIF
jgi:hypothetical protein